MRVGSAPLCSFLQNRLLARTLGLSFFFLSLGVCTAHKAKQNKFHTMRVLTHNLLCCLKCDHYPLKIRATEKVEEPEEEDLDFVVHMLPRLEYGALKSAANDVRFVLCALPSCAHTRTNFFHHCFSYYY